MIHSTWSGPSGIVHAFVPVRGNERFGYTPICYPRANHSGYSMYWKLGELKVTLDPVTCQRCLKRLGRRVKVVIERRVILVNKG